MTYLMTSTEKASTVELCHSCQVFTAASLRRLGKRLLDAIALIAHFQIRLNFAEWGFWVSFCQPDLRQGAIALTLVDISVIVSVFKLINIEEATEFLQQVSYYCK
jgi:hypothetical protein